MAPESKVFAIRNALRTNSIPRESVIVAIKIEEKNLPFHSVRFANVEALCGIFSGCSSFSSSLPFSRRARSKKKNDRIALGRIFQRQRKFFRCLGPSFSR